jgi:hypothetical protein
LLLSVNKKDLISNLKQVKRKGHTVDALASRAEEGRGKAAKSSGSLSSKLNRRFPNGATRLDKIGTPPAEHIGRMEVSGGSETSQYPEEKRKNLIP